VEAFGAQAVFGRVLGVKEMNMMLVARNVKVAYQSRERYRDKDGAENWAEWATANPELNEILTGALVESKDA